MNRFKRGVFLFSIVVACSSSRLIAVETALSAIDGLRSVGRPELFAGLAEVKGEHGEPQPAEWVLLCNDAAARGGIRELTIVGHHVVSERTPLGSFGGTGDLPRLDPALLLVDSGAIFKTVNKEAVAQHVGFDSLNYTLRTDAITGKPLWVVQLYKESGALIGTMELSAETGVILKSLDKK